MRFMWSSKHRRLPEASHLLLTTTIADVVAELRAVTSLVLILGPKAVTSVVPDTSLSCVHLQLRQQKNPMIPYRTSRDHYD